MKRGSFRGESSLSVKRLSGYAPHYKIPKLVDKRSQEWVQTIGAKDVEKEIDHAYVTLRDAMQYKRRDLKKGQDGADGTIITPDFDYNVSLRQDPQSPADALMRREVTHIRNSAAALSDAFQNAFPGVFDTIACSTLTTVDVAAIIDRLEDLETGDISLLDYDDDCTFCDIRVEGVKGILTINPSEIRVVGTSHRAPRELAQMFVNGWKALLPFTPNGTRLLPTDEADD